jgi:hypothetical protein
MKRNAEAGRTLRKTGRGREVKLKWESRKLKSEFRMER